MGAARRRIGAVAGLVLVATTPAVLTTSASGATPRPGGHHDRLAARLGASRSADVHVVRARDGVVTFVGTRAGHPLARPAGVEVHTRPGEAARAFLQQHAGIFGVTGRSSVGAGRVLRDPAGGHVVRFRQQQGGYPVLGGTLAVSLTGANQVTAVSAHTARPLAVASSPSLSASQARGIALAAAARAVHTSVRRLRVSQAPAVNVFDPTVLGIPSAAPAALVYRVEVVARHAAAPVRRLVLVDATRGSVVLDADELMQAGAEQQTVCNANDDPGVQDPTCPPTGAAGQPTVVADPAGSSDTDLQDAYAFAHQTFSFYRDVVGDSSTLGLPTDTGDRALDSTVHLCDPGSTSVCQAFANAFWDGYEMVYGDGFSSADDVVAHELTHGVTEHTSNLFYWYQSGAINESMSDVMGELVDQWDQVGTDGDSVRWVLGEDLPGSIGPVRDMADPTTAPPGVVLDSKGNPVAWYPQPDRMTSALYYAKQAADPVTGQAWPDDNGGVHINSGVGNKAAYLIVDGGSFNGVAVAGLGGADPSTRTTAITKAAKIYYLADEMLPSAADYADLYNVLPAACDTLVGTAGITPGDCATVRGAVTATEMDKQPPAAKAAEAPGCGSTPTSTDWYDNLEDTSSGRWTRASGHTAWGPFYYPEGHNVYDNYSQVYATSGVQEIWGDDPEPRAAYNHPGLALPRDGTIAMTQAVRVPVGKRQFLRFNHAYQFEWYPASGSYPALYTDGGRVEYSVDGGAWRSAAGLFDFGGYNQTLDGLSADGQTLIYQFRGFGGDSHGYTSARLDLGSLAGRSVRFRFHLTADAAVGAAGWFIDDVRFYTCGARPAAPYPVKAGAGTRAVKVTWRPPADHGTSAISSYRVVLKSGSTVLRRTTAGPAARAVTFGRLRKGQKVTGYVRAVNAAGAGPARRSNTVAVK
ncbi:MAG TPA: M4 family metallopeptidase [Marmoricola sp.]|nr:M4 family metallopeptidase [Marmoricola sp.]